MKKNIIILSVIVFITGVFFISRNSKKDSNVVNVYSTRHYESDQMLFEQFEKLTGIKVNVLKGGAEELIERIKREGEETQADVLITVDAANLHNAKTSDILQSVKSDKLLKRIPANYRDTDNYWFGLTKRARILVYDKEKTDPSVLSTYEDLAESKWKGKLIIRTSDNPYNQSLLASFIAIHGKDEALKWAKGITDNMARSPRGNDRDQAKAVIAGEGEVAVMNTYYMGQMLNSSDPSEKEAAQKMGIFFPNQNSTGTHVNVSGAGVTKYSRNRNNAVKLIEFLTEVSSQNIFAQTNYEYPVNAEAETSELVRSWGEFKSQDINMSLLGENKAEAMIIFDKAGWK